MKLKPSNSATPSIDYPSGRVYGVRSPDDPDDPEGLDFNCEVCHKTFYVPFDDYDGRWDHPPGEPICPQCDDDNLTEVSDAMKYEFSENNSGGSWRLEKADYEALRAAGWNEPDAEQDAKFGKFLDTKDVPYAWRLGWTFECESLRQAVESFEAATGRNFFEQGCNCCGAPYSISTTAGAKWESISGDSVDRMPVRPW